MRHFLRSVRSQHDLNTSAMGSKRTCGGAAFEGAWTADVRTFLTLVFEHVADAAWPCICGKLLAAMQLRSRKRSLASAHFSRWLYLSLIHI